jgi:hypothetical protein
LPNTVVRWWCRAVDLLSRLFALQQGPFHGRAGAWSPGVCTFNGTLLDPWGGAGVNWRGSSF